MKTRYDTKPPERQTARFRDLPPNTPFVYVDTSRFDSDHDPAAVQVKLSAPWQGVPKTAIGRAFNTQTAIGRAFNTQTGDLTCPPHDVLVMPVRAKVVVTGFYYNGGVS